MSENNAAQAQITATTSDQVDSKPKEKAKKGSLFREKIIRPILEAKDTPESIAMGVAVGMFVALTPTVGVQMAIAVFIGTLMNRYTRFKMNRVVAIAMCWVSNPVTVIPIYYGFLWLGWIVMGRGLVPPMTVTEWNNILSKHMTNNADTALGYVKGMLFAGIGELAIPMWIGAMIIATIISIPLYPITKRAVIRYRSRQENKEGASNV